MQIALVLAMVAVVVSGRSIDNPAENPDRPSGMEMAVATIEGSNRNGKSLAVPPPVQVTSGVVTVLGSAREGRVIEIGDDGIPIIHGVREPDDPNDTKIYRNARIVNNQLITPEDEIRINGVEGRSLSTRSNTTKSDRQARILAHGGTSSSFTIAEGPPQGTVASAKGPAIRGQQYPPFYYKKYYNNERVGVIAESSFEDDNISTSSEQIVSYSYLTAPEGNSRSQSKVPQDVVYGTGSAAKPPAQSVSSSVIFEPAKTSLILQKPQHSPQSFQPSNSLRSSADVSTSISNAIPFGHETTSVSSFAVHQAALSAGEQDQSISHFQQQPHTPHPQAPPTVFQTNPNNFIIQDTTFQAHPGAPTFSLPIPVPTQQAKRRRRPHHRNQIQVKASSEVVEHAVPAAGGFSYTSYNPYDVPIPSTKKPIYQKMIEPFMKAGSKFYEMASPVFNPMINAGHRISQSLRLPERVSGVSDSFSLETMNDYISRTVDDSNLPLVAGIAAAAAIGIAAIAVAASSNITIGKRSIDDPTEEFLYQMIEPYSLEEPTLLDRLEEYTTWTDSKCSRRIFCDVMTHVGDDYLYTIEKRLDMFLRMLNRGSAEESSLKRTADDVMQAVRRNNCDTFSCRGSYVDSLHVTQKNSGPR